MFAPKLKQMKKTHFIRLAIISIIVASTFNHSFALAMGQVTLTVKNPNPYTGNHSWFIYEKDAGQSVEDTALLKNYGNEPSQVTIYPVDASSSESGSFILALAETNQTGVGAWTTLDKKTLRINPHDTVEIPFKINIPSNVTPGEYIGGIIVENEPVKSPDQKESETTTGTSVNVKTRVGTRIYLTVPGDIIENIRTKDIRVKSDVNGIIKFDFTIENKGNVSHTPIAHIEIYDYSDKLYETIDQQLGTSMPGSITNPIVKMKKRPLIGNFYAKIAITYQSTTSPGLMHSSHEADFKEIKFTILPWKLIVLILFALAIIASLIYWRIKIKKLFEKHSETIIVRDTDNIVLIAKDRNISWSTLAKYNKLKPPYILKNGDSLIVPKKQKPKTK